MRAVFFWFLSAPYWCIRYNGKHESFLRLNVGLKKKKNEPTSKKQLAFCCCFLISSTNWSQTIDPFFLEEWFCLFFFFRKGWRLLLILNLLLDLLLQGIELNHLPLLANGIFIPKLPLVPFKVFINPPLMGNLICLFLYFRTCQHIVSSFLFFLTRKTIIF